MKLLIFDIDGTLTHLAGATRRAFDQTFVKRFGVNANINGVKMHGRTDPIIFQECYYLSGLTGDWRKAYDEFRDDYLAALPTCIAGTPGARLHPGIRELLDALEEDRDRAALALGTGNMEGGARRKIGHWNLNRYFPVGGFGDVHHERPDILRDAVASAESHYRQRFLPADTWVIGDTVHDVDGGKALGLMTMGVATGGMFSFAELIAARADVVFDDLGDTATVLHAFGLS